MKWYKKIGLLATTGLALFGLGACSNEGKSADGTVTIEYFNQKKEMTKTLEEIARDFEKENPKVKVKVVNVPNGGEVLKTRVLAGDVPDVVNIYPQSIELQEWAKAGVFEDLSNKDYLKRVKNGYAEKYAVNGKVYNVPFTANAYGIYYNKDKFEELGLKVPETWDEFEQLVKDIVAKGQTPFGIAGADAWTLNGYNQLAFATAAGGGTSNSPSTAGGGGGGGGGSTSSKPKPVPVQEPAKIPSITKTKELVEKEFKTQNEYLLPIFTSFYSQLVLTSLASNQEITKEMVHEAWSIAIDNDNPDKIHSSLIPFEYLSDYIQDLDQYYVEKLTNVLEYLKELKLVINNTRK